jgi:aminopeptidase N
MGNFYPVACVYEDGNYIIDSYHYNGDPFYSDMANYNVNITIPSNYKLANTGNIISTIENENTTTYSIQARTVRDFAFVLSDKFNIVADNINNTTVNYFYYDNKYPNESLKAGIDAVRTFNKLFGDYPYAVLNIVEANFVHGGMEYPNLVLISDEVDIESDYINVIVHEVAHQWWYGIIGNNEFNYGWLDEGLTEYSTLLFYEENPSYNVNTETLIKNTTNSYVTFVEIYNKVFNTVDTSMNRKLNEYNNESEYVYIAYVKGMLLFDNIRELVGDEKFIKCLQTYYEDYKYKVATPDGLISSFEKGSNQKLQEVFESWINGKVQILQIN